MKLYLEQERVFRYNVLIGHGPGGVYMKSEKRVLFLLAASATVILLVTVLTFFSGGDKDKPAGSKKPLRKPTQAVAAEEIKAEYNKLLFVKSVDTEAGSITLFDLEEGGEVVLTYGLAADIRSKYGNLTYAASLKYGDIVRAEYNPDGVLVRMQLSSEHWELHGVEDFSISDSMLSVNGVNYRITETTVAYCEGERIAHGEVRDIDRVELWGHGSEVLAIRVVKGHGSIKLVNCTEFQGAKVTFGDESHTLSGEPTYLVREGKYTVSVIGDTQAAAAEVTVARNEQLVIDLYEYGGKPIESAQVRFKITPFSAVLKIDGERVDYYEQDLTLEYGEHKIEAELGGYITYKGYLTISKPYHTFQIDLPERQVEVGDDTGTEGNGSDGEEDTPDDTGDSAGTDDPTEEDTGDSTGSGTDAGEDTGDDSGQDTSGEDADGFSEYRFVPIGAAGGYEYDETCFTYLTAPSDVVVLLDGISLGTAPIKYEKILGPYNIVLQKNGEVVEEFLISERDDGKDVYLELEY